MLKYFIPFFDKPALEGGWERCKKVGEGWLSWVTPPVTKLIPFLCHNADWKIQTNGHTHLQMAKPDSSLVWRNRARKIPLDVWFPFLKPFLRVGHYFNDMDFQNKFQFNEKLAFHGLSTWKDYEKNLKTRIYAFGSILRGSVAVEKGQYMKRNACGAKIRWLLWRIISLVTIHPKLDLNIFTSHIPPL